MNTLTAGLQVCEPGGPGIRVSPGLLLVPPSDVDVAHHGSSLSPARRLRIWMVSAGRRAADEQPAWGCEQPMSCHPRPLEWSLRPVCSELTCMSFLFTKASALLPSQVFPVPDFLLLHPPDNLLMPVRLHAPSQGKDIPMAACRQTG